MLPLDVAFPDEVGDQDVLAHDVQPRNARLLQMPLEAADCRAPMSGRLGVEDVSDEIGDADPLPADLQLEEPVHRATFEGEVYITTSSRTTIPIVSSVQYGKDCGLQIR